MPKTLTISLSGTIWGESGDVFRRPRGKAEDPREEFK